MNFIRHPIENIKRPAYLILEIISINLKGLGFISKYISPRFEFTLIELNLYFLDEVRIVFHNSNITNVSLNYLRGLEISELKEEDMPMV